MVAVSVPACRSMTTRTERPVRSTPSRSSPVAPARQIQTPLMATSIASASNSTCGPTVPTAARMRPQFGVLAEEGGLHQVVAGHGRGRPRRRRPRWRRAPPRSRSPWWRPPRRPAVARPGAVQARVTAAPSSSAAGSIAGGAGGQQQHGVVGGHRPVGVQPVEGHPGRRPQRGVQVRGIGDRVGGQHDEHGGQPGGEHAGALGHPPTVNPPTLDLHRLGHRVGGHDGGRGVQSAVARTAPRRRCRRRAAACPSAAAGRSARWTRPRSAAARCSSSAAEMLCGGDGVGVPLGSGAGVGAAGIEHDGGQFGARAGQDALAPAHRRGLDPVAGEHAGGGAAAGRR